MTDKKFRFHVFPNLLVPSTIDNCLCAYNNYAIAFSKIFTENKHDVIFYGYDIPKLQRPMCTQYITVSDMSLFKKYFKQIPEFNSAKYLTHEETFQKIDNKVIDGQLEKEFMEKAYYIMIKQNLLLDDDIILHFYYSGTWNPLYKLTNKRYLNISPCIWGSTYTMPYAIFKSHYVHEACMTRQLTKKEVYDAVKMHIVQYPGFDAKEFKYNSKPISNRKAFLFLARVQKYKGIDVFIELAKRNPDKEFWIAGNPDPIEICSDIKSYPNIKYVGFANKILKKLLLNQAKCLIQPTAYSEPFGCNVIEAYFSGTPVITSNRGAFRETVINGITGYLCNDGLENYENAMNCIDKIEPKDCLNYAYTHFNHVNEYHNLCNIFRYMQEDFNSTSKILPLRRSCSE
jgi:glycosyltransferase involved in cell wall biosynthesis